MSFTIDDPPATQPITELFAYVMIDDAGNEGICATTVGTTSMPLVFGYQRIAEKAMPFAEELTRKTGKTIRLVKFTTRQELRVIRP
jgi:hypothetical protein